MSNSNLPSIILKLITYCRRAFAKAPVDIDLHSGDKIVLDSHRVQFPLDGCAVALVIDKYKLHLYPDSGALKSTSDKSPDMLLVQKLETGSGIEHFQRLQPDASLFVDIEPIDGNLRVSEEYSLSNSTVQISHHHESIVIEASKYQQNAYVIKIPEVSGSACLLKRRQRSLGRVQTIFGGAIKKLDPAEGLLLVQSINKQLALSPHRSTDDRGSPGSVVELPENLIPILIGDLHANIDNLLKILSENAYIDSLDRGDAALIFLGDAIHSEDPDDLESMESSLIMMDLIFKLMLQFPDQVFFVLGNHDSFSEEVVKSGVRQGILWQKYVTKERGDGYQKALEEFYLRSPLIAFSSRFVACHAGPPNNKVSKKELINAKHNPELTYQLLWNRQQSVSFPAGYTRKEVQRFRKSLGLEPHTPFIVGHSPFSKEKTTWCHIGGIKNHHLVTSARPDQVGVFVLINGDMEPQSFTSEPLLKWTNQNPVSRQANSD